MRKALMVGGKNIARKEIIFSLAEAIRDRHNTFDVELFKKDFAGASARESFKLDLQKAAFHKISRYPTLTFVNNSGKGIVMTGFRQANTLEAALDEIEEA